MIGNSITIVGNLTRDPELRHTANGFSVADIGVAVNRRFERKGQQVEEVSYFDVTCWGSLGENVSSSLGKGTRVIVMGRLEQQRYETREGEKRSSMKIIADEVGPALTWATTSVERTSPNRGNDSSSNAGGGESGSQERPEPKSDSQEVQQSQEFSEEPF